MPSERPTTCPAAETLVDYCDRLLALGERATVAAHLEQCPRCRHEVDRLDRSLDLAKEVWQQAQGDGTEAVNRPQRVILGRVAWMAAAAGIVISAMSVFFWVRARGNRVGPPPLVAIPSATPATDDPVAKVERETQAARLVACAQLLGQFPEVREEAQWTRHYVARTYGDTAAVSGLDLKPSSQGEPK